MARQAPGSAHERGAVYTSSVAARGVASANIAREHAMLELATNLFERPEASPAIRNATHLLPKLSVQIGWASNAASIARAHGVRI